MHRRALIAAALAAPALARAQSAWPNDKPVEVIVPFPPGGGVDAATRLIMAAVAERVPGMRVVVSNRPGAGSQVGLEATFNAAPDGYTLGAVSIPALSAIPIERPVRYRPLDFTFVANLVDDPNCVFVRAESPLRTLAELLAQAKARPGGLEYGTTGIGSDDHIMMLALEALAGLPPLVHVPFTGTGTLLPQLMGGHLSLAVGNATEISQHIREGKLRSLAVASAARVPEVPEIPTFRELGLDIVASASRGIIGPPGIPSAITARLEAAFREAMASAAFRQEAARAHLPLRPLFGATYRSMAAEVDGQLRELWHRRPWKG